MSPEGRCRFNHNLYCHHAEEERTVPFCQLCVSHNIAERLDKIKRELQTLNTKFGTFLREEKGLHT